MKEKHIQTLFGQQNQIEGFFELKLCKGKSIRWDSVRDHQIKALSMAASEKGLYYKIPDTPVSATQTEDGNRGFRFTKRKPFDCFFFRGKPAYVVICWYVPRQRKTLYYIEIHDYLRTWHESSKKSFNEGEARAMARYLVELKG